MYQQAEGRLGSRFRRAESAVSDNISCDVMPKRRKLGLERPAPIQLPLFAEAASLIRAPEAARVGMRQGGTDRAPGAVVLPQETQKVTIIP
jgi:hypothetical protein